ncbi:MAG: BamA/TamA family outer membrane protein [Bacteroidales bacterium]|nr:BamA/TamA family outer membrane protein [Bacteroidales bacterium]
MNKLTAKYKNQLNRLLGFFLLMWLISACNTTKHLGESEFLYTGAEINLQSDIDIPDKKDLMSDLEEAVYPEPNRKMLGLFRFRLWMYYMAGETKKEKGFKHWLKYKLGEPPVLLEDVDQDNVSQLMKEKAFNRGHFKPVVTQTTNTKEKKASVEYTIRVNQPYRIDSVYFPPDSNTLMKKIINTCDESLLENGGIYDLGNIDQERQRIRQYLLNKGYYYFSPSYLFYEADTTNGGKNVDLYLKLKKDIPHKSLIPYRINNIYVYSNYSLEDTTSTSCTDTLWVDEMNYISRIDRFRAEEITNVVFLKKGEIYNRLDHEKTISRLIGMNAFKFVNIRFEETTLSDSLAGGLNMFIYLTPDKIHSVRAEVKGIAKSNNFAGPGLEVTYLNRNIFRGAELLTVTAHGNWETQIGGNRENLNSYELGLNTRLQYPRLETPFNLTKNQQKFVPTTNIDLGYNFHHRVKYYTAHSLNTGFGYTWKNALTSRNDLTIIGIEYYQLNNTTELFDEKLDANPYLASTFEDQFMIGPKYSYTYNNLVKNDLQNNFYFQGRTDMSGLIVNGIMQAIDAAGKGNQPTDKLFGSLYAQYFKIDGDVRFYQNFKNQSKMVYRFFAGVGFPFGRSQTLPYVKQYYSGGTNGIRAFRARELGPGDYYPPDSVNSVFFEQTGDIKLEGNVEYRFPIQGPLKGAFFVDAGNIWLINETEDRPGSQFGFGSFYKEIAVGTGLGLRFDLSFLVLRLDLAFPLRKPWLAEGERWVADDIFGYKGWGRENLVLNIAIGYPF